MRELFQGIGSAYRVVWTCVTLMTRSSVAVIGLAALGMLTVIAGKPPSNAIPLGALWLLAGGTCRMVLRVMPAPGGAGEQIPAEKRPPPAMLAVSITPIAGAAACPPVAAMISSVPSELQALVRG